MILNGAKLSRFSANISSNCAIVVLRNDFTMCGCWQDTREKKEVRGGRRGWGDEEGGAKNDIHLYQST